MKRLLFSTIILCCHSFIWCQSPDTQVSKIVDRLRNIGIQASGELEEFLKKNDSYILKNGSIQDKLLVYQKKNELNPGEIIYADSALILAKLSRDSNEIARAYILCGETYNYKGNNEEALKFLNLVDDYTQDVNILYHALIKSSDIFLDINSFVEARYYLAGAEQLIEEIDDELKISLHSNYGFLYLNSNELDSAKYHYTSASALSLKYDKVVQYLMFQENLGIIESEMGNIELAENTFQSILHKAEEIGNKELKMFVYTDLCYLYHEVEKFDEAIKYCKLQYETAIELQSMRYQVLALDELYKINQKIGDYKSSLTYYELMKEGTDSLMSATHARNLTETRLKSQYESKIKMDSLQLANAKLALKSEQTNKRNLGSLFILAFLGGLFSFWQFLKARKAQKRSDELLLNILPKPVAEELKTTGKTSPKLHKNVSILFADIKNFTQISSIMPPTVLVNMLDDYFGTFDEILIKWNVEKIKTIGDAYLAVHGLSQGEKNQTVNIIYAALEIQEAIDKIQGDYSAYLKNESLEMRIGIHTGTLVAGVVGKSKIQFDIWGDAVNIASRIESSGIAGKVNISRDTYEIVGQSSDLSFESRGKIDVKNRGEMEMYFVSKYTKQSLQRAQM